MKIYFCRVTCSQKEFCFSIFRFRLFLLFVYFSFKQSSNILKINVAERELNFWFKENEKSKNGKKQKKICRSCCGQHWLFVERNFLLLNIILCTLSTIWITFNNISTFFLGTRHSALGIIWTGLCGIGKSLLCIWKAFIQHLTFRLFLQKYAARFYLVFDYRRNSLCYNPFNIWTILFKISTIWFRLLLYYFIPITHYSIQYLF